jgi:hypothetical protein
MSAMTPNSTADAPKTMRPNADFIEVSSRFNELDNCRYFY